MEYVSGEEVTILYRLFKQAVTDNADILIYSRKAGLGSQSETVRIS